MDSSAARQIGVVLETTILGPILRSVFDRDDGIGEFGTQAMAREIAEADAGGFAAAVSAAIERRR